MIQDVGFVPGPGFGLMLLPEWRSLCVQRPNVLLEGSDELTASVVHFLAPHLCRPVVWKPSQAPLALPTGRCGALVLQNVASMSRWEQVELLQWLENAEERTQVISTTAQPLYAAVGRGLFDKMLYYRLNIMRLCVDSSLHAENSAWRKPLDSRSHP
jgi:hypothetical protein